MAVIDMRKKTNDEVSFYVFDDLRFQQNQVNHRGYSDIYRYDSLKEALEKFREIPEDMTPALGMHRDAMSELDLVQRREGESVLVTDYMNFFKWRNDPEVRRAVETLKMELNLQWQMNSRLIGETILIPLERNFNRIPDPCFTNKNLNPVPAAFPLDKINPRTAVCEVFVNGEGWMDFSSFYKKASAFGYNNPHCVKASQFNVRYIDEHGHVGAADMSPLDLQILMERYTFQHGTKEEIQSAMTRLVDDVADAIYPNNHGKRGLFEDSHTGHQLRNFVTDEVVRRLEAVRDDAASTDEQIAAACCALTRVKGLPRPSLEHQMKNAAEKAAETGGVERNPAEKER